MGFDLKIFVPILFIGSFVLSVPTFFITAVCRKAPEARARRKLDAIMKKNGLCRDYTDLLFLSARSEMKNYFCIEIAVCYCISGEVKQAQTLLDRIDIVSVLDIAQSTGNYRTAAYYYAGSIFSSIISGNLKAAEKAYENGRFYLDAVSNDTYILSILALYYLKNGLKVQAADYVRKININNIHKKNHIFKNAIVTVNKAYILLETGFISEAKLAVNEALKFNINKNYSDMVTSIAKKCC